MCLESIRRHHPTLQVLDPETVAAKGGNHLLDKTRGELIQYRADLLRFWLMREFGGVWFDADIIAFRPSGLIDNLQSNHAWQAAGYYVPPRRKGPRGKQGGNVFCDQHFCFRRGRLAMTAYDACLAALRAPSASYGSTNQGALQEVWQRFPGKVHRTGHWLYARIPFHDPWCYFRKETDEAFAARPAFWPQKDRPYTYHLGGYVMHAFGHLSRAQLLASRTFLGFLLRKAEAGI
jgi:hypothetical protein